jgi:hypothetical protein
MTHINYCIKWPEQFELKWKTTYNLTLTRADIQYVNSNKLASTGDASTKLASTGDASTKFEQSDNEGVFTTELANVENISTKLFIHLNVISVDVIRQIIIDYLIENTEFTLCVWKAYLSSLHIKLHSIIFINITYCNTAYKCYYIECKKRLTIFIGEFKYSLMNYTFQEMVNELTNIGIINKIYDVLIIIDITLKKLGMIQSYPTICTVC